MSVVANVEPLFQPCINPTLVEIVSRNIADITDPKGLRPCAVSRAAFRTKEAASNGVSRPTTTSVTKLLKLVSMLRSHGPLIPADCGGNVIPCAANQDRNCGSVSRITDHSIHL